MILKVISGYSYYYAIKAPEYKRLVVYYHSGIKYTSIIKYSTVYSINISTVVTESTFLPKVG